MVQEIRIEELLERHKMQEITLIDVRSQSEFADATIPGSLNIPLFDDEERAVIGTLYKQVSFDAAKEKGLEVVSAKLPQYIKQFASIPGPKAVFCWRGGMRSKTTATLLSLMDIRVARLQGGFRSFRKWVVDFLEHYELTKPAIVINGYTGSGKTELLRQLAQKGLPVLDLEGMAGHRGSIFGQVGLTPNNQKTFEAFLALRLQELNNSPYILLEAESKRIGKINIPDFLMEAKAKGEQLFVDLPLEKRVAHILEEYKPSLHKAACIQAFDYIRSRIHTPIAAEIHGHLQEERFAEAVALLLAYYYDPRYTHANLQYEQRVVCSVETVEDGVDAVLQQINERFPISSVNHGTIRA
jgi:tRNA 2-selenouridine synthase